MKQFADPKAAQPELRSEVGQELQAIFARLERTAEAYGPDFSRLWSLASRHVQGGKLLRPLLLLETYEALIRSEESSPRERACDQAQLVDRLDRSEVVRIAAAVEALHYAFILHDDVIDGDFVRRGKPNLIGELAQIAEDGTGPEGARHWAQTGGILAGNLLLSCAHQLFARAALPVERKERLLDLLEQTVFETTAGEFSDVGLSDGVISPDLGTVLAMTGRKTASYSFELPLRAAVILAGGSSALENTMSVAGSHLGLAYQLQDDLLSTFGDPNFHGKAMYSDLQQGKETAIISFARMSDSWALIEGDFGNPDLSMESARDLSDRLRDCGAEDFVQDLIREQAEAFFAAVSGIGADDGVPAGVQDVLFTLFERIEGRKS
jgi:geranylgeranyl diphosphate synthase type II